jgi:hypothetical protein
VTEQGFSIDDEMDQYDNGAQVVHLLLTVLEPSSANANGEPKRVPVGVVRIITAKNKVRCRRQLSLSFRLAKPRQCIYLRGSPKHADKCVWYHFSSADSLS